MNLLKGDDMFYGAPPSIFEKAKTLRSKMTPEENMLWDILSKHQMMGFKFRRQHPINMFIADFYCHKAKLVVEIDGGIHLKRDQKEYDAGRSVALNQFGIRVLRFKNDEVLNESLKVVERIKEELMKITVR